MGTKLSAGRSGVHKRDAPHNDCGWSNYMGIAYASQKN